MTWLKWYDPNTPPTDLRVCDWRGVCEVVSPTPSAGCYVASTSLEGAVTGVLVDGTRESPESLPIYVPEPPIGVMLLVGIAGLFASRGRKSNGRQAD